MLRQKVIRGEPGKDEDGVLVAIADGTSEADVGESFNELDKCSFGFGSFWVGVSKTIKNKEDNCVKVVLDPWK